MDSPPARPDLAFAGCGSRVPAHRAGNPARGRHVSNLDKAKDKAEEAKGHVKEAVGKAKGDRSLENEGKAQKASGDLKQAGEKVKDAVRRK
jgi:uncharacterized protein YjbJ (UPF0337 family)